uniref:Uncharacterized protein n=1 Tax=Glossina palpalis gambiensis TaxID=67801 RepID=A0A1B0BDQ5_9MUSC
MHTRRQQIIASEKIRQNIAKQKIKKKNSEHKIQTLPINKQLEGAVTKNQANTKAGEQQTCSQAGKHAQHHRHHHHHRQPPSTLHAKL